MKFKTVSVNQCIRFILDQEVPTEKARILVKKSVRMSRNTTNALTALIKLAKDNNIPIPIRKSALVGIRNAAISERKIGSDILQLIESKEKKTRKEARKIFKSLTGQATSFAASCNLVANNQGGAETKSSGSEAEFNTKEETLSYDGGFTIENYNDPIRMTRDAWKSACLSDYSDFFSNIQMIALKKN